MSVGLTPNDSIDSFSVGTGIQRRQWIEDVIEWDVMNWSRALAFWADHSKVQVTRSSRALEIGSRNGGISLWLAQRGFNVLCSDIRRPGERAVDLHKRYGLRNRIQYASLDVKALDVEDTFDVVCFKSVLGAVGTGDLASQRRSVEEMHRVLRPGGEVWFAENLRASVVHGFMRRLFIPWAKSWHYLTIDELRALFDGFANLDIIAVGFFAAFGRTERQRHILSVLDNYLIGRLVPTRWRYIAIGVARK